MNRRSFISLFAALPAVSLLGEALSKDAIQSDAFAKLPVGAMDKELATDLALAGYSHLELFVTREIVPEAEEKIFIDKCLALKKLSIPTRYLNGFMGGEIKMVGPDADHDKIEQKSKIIFARARQLGVSIITIGSAASRKCPQDFEIAKARDQFSKMLGRIGPIARDHGIRLTIENLNSTETNICTTIAESVEVITAAGPDVFLTADIYHMMKQNDLPSELLKAQGRVIHCHVAERELRTSPGTQGDDFRPYLKVLKQMNYRGAFSFECKWAKSTSPEKALEVFRQQMASA